MESSLASKSSHLIFRFLLALILIAKCSGCSILNNIPIILRIRLLRLVHHGHASFRRVSRRDEVGLPVSILLASLDS